MASRTDHMSRLLSLGSMIAARTGWTNWASHWLSKPAPPALVGLVIQALFHMSSAMLIFQPCEASMSSLIHCSSDQASGMSPSGPLRM